MMADIMAINVQVDKNNNESSANVIRRFTKRVQGAGILQKVRNGRYHNRLKSKNVDRVTKLRKLANKVTYEKMLKLGKISEPKSYRR
jgi:ribosomal protein S21